MGRDGSSKLSLLGLMQSAYKGRDHTLGKTTRAYVPTKRPIELLL